MRNCSREMLVFDNDWSHIISGFNFLIWSHINFYEHGVYLFSSFSGLAFQICLIQGIHAKNMERL